MSRRSSTTSLRVRAAFGDRELRRDFMGRAPAKSDFMKIARDDLDCFDDETDRLIFKFRKAVLPRSVTKLARRSFGEIDELERPSVTRRAAAGKLDVERFKAFRDDVVGIVPLTPTTGHLRLADGRVLRQPMSNPVHSYLAGYGVERFTNVARKNLLTHRYPERWSAAVPFFQAIAGVLKEEMPDVYARHLEQAKRHPSWVIPDTALSTVTINVNYESHFHFDVGDFRNGYSTLSVVEIGKYTGGFLVFPRYKIAVDVREGDVLMCQSHVDMHGNFALTRKTTNAKRVSFVTYLKEKLGTTSNRLAGPDPVEEWSDGRRVAARKLALQA